MTFQKGHKLSVGRPDKKMTIAAYSVEGFVEDPDGNHKSFNIYRWKNVLKSTDEIKGKTSKDYVFVRSCYKFRTAKRVLMNFATKKPIPKQFL